MFIYDGFDVVDQAAISLCLPIFIFPSIAQVLKLIFMNKKPDGF